MKKVQVIVWVLAAAIMLQSCYKLVGEGPVVNEVRTTPNFTGVYFKLPAILEYTEGSDFKVELQSQQNILNEIEAIMSGNDLVLRFRSPNTRLKPSEELVIKITAPALTKLEVHGSGIIHALTNFTPASLRLAIDGSGIIDISEVTTHSMDVEIDGSGRIVLADGTAETQSLEIDGSGEMDFGNLVSQHTSTRISGSGTMKVNVDQTLDVNISGSGSVRYRGNPVVTSSISGSGSVSKW